MNTKLAEISSLMKDDAPIFIVGAPRSGTSILYRTIQNHSSFQLQNCKNESGVELTESNVFKDPYAIYTGTESTAFSYMLKDQHLYEQFLDLIQPIYQNQKLFIGKKAIQKTIPYLGLLNSSTRVTLWKAIQNDTLTRAFLYYAKQARGVKRLVEKTPQHIAWLPEIKATFPNSKLLFMSRHPIDVYSSYRRRMEESIKQGKDQKKLQWLSLSIDNFCKKYSNHVELALTELKANPNGFMMVRYEDFTNNPRVAVQELLSFMDEAFEESCIPQDKRQKSDWKDDPNLFGGIKSTTKKWQDFMSEVEAKAIEDCLAPLLNQLNYARYTT